MDELILGDDGCFGELLDLLDVLDVGEVHVCVDHLLG